jgi:hypothetical protein
MKQNSNWVCTGFLNGICVVYFDGGGGGWSHCLYFLGIFGGDFFDT